MQKSLIPTFDPVHDVLHYESQALDANFRAEQCCCDRCYRNCRPASES